MSISKRYVKTAAEDRFFDIDHTSRLAGATVAAVEEVDCDAGLSVLSYQLTGPVLRLGIGGGVNGRAYNVTTTVRLSDNAIRETAIQVRVRGVKLRDAVIDAGAAVIGEDFDDEPPDDVLDGGGP